MKKNKIILFIDTSSNREIKVGLEIGGKEDVLTHPVDRKTQEVLPLTQRLLKKHKIQLKDLTGIRVNPGPGSFTGLRVGVSVANTLGYLLKIPVNGKKVGELIEPRYNYRLF
jgi:tRNA threonylcarbamoyladenosine biosynthesis protein TsaB